MAKRVIDEPCNIPLYIRVSDSMKKAVDSAADECQMSTSEWLRRAVSRELEREEVEKSTEDDEYLLPNGKSVVTKECLIEALRELKKEGFSFENL